MQTIATTATENTTEASATAQTLRRRLVLPVRAVRAGLGVDSEAAVEGAALVQEQVIPALDAAADQVTAVRRRVEKRIAKMDRSGESPAAKRHRAKALAGALATVDGVHRDLTGTIADLDR